MSNTTAQQVLSVGGLPVGFVPQFHASATPMADIQRVIDSATPASLNMTLRPATYGWYAQTYPHEHFDGEQLLRVKDDVVASGAIFEPAVMPLQGWTGYTAANNSHALSIARVLKQFTDEGVEVRLR
ncbi:hypothetical protein FA09DRAFT_329945 [Tilletiopsis washingtonensis]|jgi:hypothetical protein|uniref:Uncharacterized protein n=1 Tax=Tilletiopsis washingtonensis TaxID=58919 RepID=A0A316Z9U1_9BASI|nr:hypothetical protein FA09DRAFT_329945 [Tilletiopsis washingtonensis]PWN98351.1 hypothetical protein FA09DRAFT_329945 [Tilletiopsis washingtonensis]